MSGFPKILWNSDVAVGLTWAWNDGVARSVALIDGTHATILELCDHLEWCINTIDPAATVTVSSVGIVTVTIPSIVALNWGGTSNALSTVLGFTEAEALSGTAVTSTNQHLNGYYPGCISYGWNAGRGAGFTRGILWEPDYHEVRTVAGNRSTRCVSAATPQDTCEIACSIIKCDARAGANEWADNNRGVRAWINECTTIPFRIYPDRLLGVVNTPGTEGIDYYTCAFAGPLRRQDGPHPSFCSWSVPINWEAGP